MRKALVVGIDNYPDAPLTGCVNDAEHVFELLRLNSDNSPNFDCLKMVSSEGVVDRRSLRTAVERLFASESEIAVLFFAGHGTSNNLGGFLVAEDSAQYNEGLSMTDVLTLANNSPAHEIVIILDCCHSGQFGQLPALANDQAQLREGITILTACRAAEMAAEGAAGGLFTGLVCDALAGGAADVCGKVTVAGVYAHADEGLAPWDDQRPLFKSHVSTLKALRMTAPRVPIDILRLVPKFFPAPDDEFKLDPSYEPDAEPHHPENEEVFGKLQKLRAASLVVPVGEDHMYYAAIHSKSCRLTALGRHYWQLANRGKI